MPTVQDRVVRVKARRLPGNETQFKVDGLRQAFQVPPNSDTIAIITCDCYSLITYIKDRILSIPGYLQEYSESQPQNYSTINDSPSL